MFEPLLKISRNVLAKETRHMQRKYRLVLIDGSRRPEEIHRSLKATNNKFLSPMIIKKFSLFHNAYKSKTDLNAANVHY